MPVQPRMLTICVRAKLQYGGKVSWVCRLHIGTSTACADRSLDLQKRFHCSLNMFTHDSGEENITALAGYGIAALPPEDPALRTDNGDSEIYRPRYAMDIAVSLFWYCFSATLEPSLA